MPPKGRGRPRVPNNGQDNSMEEVYDIISLGESSDNSSVVITGRRPAPKNRRSTATSARRRGGQSVQGARQTVPDVYQDLLAEALQTSDNTIPERPPKRRKTRRVEDSISTGASAEQLDSIQAHDELEDDVSVDFEDVLPQNEAQTVYQDSSEESDYSDVAWEDLNVATDFIRHVDDEDGTGDLQLTLDSTAARQRQSLPARRKINNVDRALRLEIHKMHILCLLFHVSRRNHWCNDQEVQSALKPLISRNVLANLRPPNTLSQFRQTDLLKTGLEQLGQLWNSKFEITARGLRRPLWVEHEHQLKDYKLAPDSEPPIELSDFRTAARILKGSRDLGAQLYCALLRSTGLEARLVCSLQPLPFSASVKNTVSATETSTPQPIRTPSPESSELEEAIDLHGNLSPFGQGGPGPSAAPFSSRRRLGHPNAAGYQAPVLSSPVRTTPPKRKKKRILESPYPVYWIEVLDEAHQKWIPVDPVVSMSVAKTRVFEPPLSDIENIMSYVIAFEDDRVAKDVTRRYAKAYNSKTRKMRVESTDHGARWWNKTLRPFRRDWIRDLDQIEDTELAAFEAREPMPKSIADFKDHPSYALERHLRKNEVLVNRHEVGKIAAGRDPSAPGGKKMESVYRRSAVQVARSADRWYRLGRDIKLGQQPVKIAAARTRDEDQDEAAGVGLYTEGQTEIYQAPPVVDGRVPRNAFGNLDVYVPSMVPPGGVHIPANEAASVARLLGIDYADAITGFKFEGRRGRPVIDGVIIAAEYKEAVEAVVDAFRDERARAEEEARMQMVLRMWKRFLIGLRIKERVDTYEVEGEDGGDVDIDKADDDDEGMRSEEYEYDDDGGGGFFPE